MNTQIRNILLTFSLLLTTAASAQYIQVNDTYTAQRLVQDVLINSTCATVSNFSVSGGNFGSGAQSYGFFSGAGSTFPFANGIVLSTGSAVKTQGPNTSLLDEGNNMNWGGDADLEQALDINNSVNATILEFDFIPLGNKISFDYMLSSEEYHDNAPCRYSDGFAFLLKEANTANPYRNLAVVPGTNTPVKVTSVRPLIGGSGGCSAQNEQYFGGFNDQNHPTNFNGQTTVLTAESSVTPGVLYHIKLVIADEGNYRYDSAIFLGGGSFEVTSDLGEDRLIAGGNPVCDGESLVLDATNPNAIGYKWYVNGGTTPVATTPTYTVAAPGGDYRVEVQLTSTCFSEGKIKVEYAPAITGGTYTLLQCDDNNDGLTLFNLEMAGQLATANDPDLAPSYFLTRPEAENGTTGAITTPLYNNTIPNQQLFVRIENRVGCFGVATVTLATSANTVTDPAPLAECDTDGNDDGFFTFDLTQRNGDILTALPTGLQLEYYTSYNEALASSNPIPTPANFTNTTPANQTVYARLYNSADCYGIAELDLIVYSFGTALQDEQAILCSNEANIALDAGSGFTSYTWNTTPPTTGQVFYADKPGIYSVNVTNANNCTGTKTFTVLPSGPATGATITANDFTGGQNSFTVTPQGTGSYEYSLNGGAYQPVPVFSNLAAGQYILSIRDTNGCGPDYTETVYVLDYPLFFTPNGDGINEIWRIPYLQFSPQATVNVFDRYGKQINSFKGSDAGWNGTYNGTPLPSSDYWFIITLENGRIIKGHFSMIR
jgi:gliding motility-associated-like protein